MKTEILIIDDHMSLHDPFVRSIRKNRPRSRRNRIGRCREGSRIHFERSEEKSRRFFGLQVR